MVEISLILSEGKLLLGAKQSARDILKEPMHWSKYAVSGWSTDLMQQSNPQLKRKRPGASLRTKTKLQQFLPGRIQNPNSGQAQAALVT